MPDRIPLGATSPRAERALLAVSRQFAAQSSVRLRDVLAVVGELTDAVCCYLVFADDVPSLSLEFPLQPAGPTAMRTGAHRLPVNRAGSTIVWTQNDSDEQCDIAAFRAALPAVVAEPTRAARPLETNREVAAIAVPLLTDDETFIGYLGLERTANGSGDFGRGDFSEEASVLVIVADLLVTHLGRLAAEESSRRNEERWQRLVAHHPDPILVTFEDNIVYANVAAAGLLCADEPATLRSFRLQDFLSAADEGGVWEKRKAQLTDKVPHPFEHTILRLDGEERIVESVSVPFPGIEGAVQSVMRDVTERKESEERYRTFVETISEGVWRVELDHPMPTTPSTSAQVDHILCHARLAEYNPAMSRLFWSDQYPPLGSFVEGLIGDHGPPFARAFVEAGYELHNHEVMVRSRRTNTPRYFSINAVGRIEQDCLVSIWGSGTEITDRVEMERSMIAALEEQQERIGRDLHDSVGQLLTGVRMLSENLTTRFADTPGAPTSARISNYAAEALDRVREICRGLVPPQLYQVGASAALGDFVDHINELGEPTCTFRHDGKAEIIDPNASLQFYRILQEATTNALKHAQAKHIWVYFGYDDDEVVLEIEDDGVGFVIDRDRARSIGLYSMHRRANSVGARLAIETQPDAGTTIRVTLSARALKVQEVVAS